MTDIMLWWGGDDKWIPSREARTGPSTGSSSMASLSYSELRSRKGKHIARTTFHGFNTSSVREIAIYKLFISAL